MVTPYIYAAVESVRGMHLIFSGELEAMYCDHLNKMRRHSSWGFVGGFFLPLLFSEGLLMQAYIEGLEDDEFGMDWAVPIRVAATAALLCISLVVCSNCCGRSTKVSNEGVWCVIVLAALSTLLVRRAHGHDAGTTAVFQALLVVQAYLWLPLRVPAASLILLLTSLAVGVASASKLNDTRRAEVGAVISAGTAALRGLALLETSSRRDWLAQRALQNHAVASIGSSSMSSVEKAPSSHAAGDGNHGNRVEHLDTEGGRQDQEASVPGQVPDGEVTTPFRSKVKRRTAPTELKVHKANSLHSRGERRHAASTDGPPSPRLKPMRRRSEGQASLKRINIEELKEMGQRATMISQKEALDPRHTAAANAIAEPLCQRKHGRQLTFQDEQAVPESSWCVVPVAPSSAPAAAPSKSPSPSLLLDSRMNTPLSVFSAFGSTSQDHLASNAKHRASSRASLLSKGRDLDSSGRFMSYSQSSSSLDSAPAVPTVASSACQTDIVWKEGEWHCTRCAKPPNMPGAPTRSDSSRRPHRSKSGKASSAQHLKHAMEMVGRLQGAWRLVHGPDNVSPWLTRFTIYRTEVYCEEVVKKLDFVETVQVALGGGELVLDNEDFLHRHGRTGQHLMFERIEDEEVDEEFEENIFVRQTSNQSADSVCTIGGEQRIAETDDSVEYPMSGM